MRSWDNGGRIIPEGMEDITAFVEVANPYWAGLPPRPPLTRRQRLIGRLRGYLWRVRGAIEMLRGTHDCGDL